MKDYELTVVFHPDLEMNLDPALDKVKKVLESNGGKITKEESDGKKRLAYSIKGQDFGIYYYLEVALPADSLNKISAVFNITDEILRYLLVRVDERKNKMNARRQANESEDEGSKEEVEDNTTNETEKGE